MYQVSDCIWTCSKDQVACYSDTGIKIFSKNSSDCKPLHTKDKKIHESRENKDLKDKEKDMKEQKDSEKRLRLMGTFITNIELNNRKFAKTPEYLMVYNNTNNKYYTFMWADYQHSFPCSIMVSRDYLHYETLIQT